MERFRFSKKDNEFYKEFIEKEKEAIKKSDASSFLSGSTSKFATAFKPILEPKSGRLDPRPIDLAKKVELESFSLYSSKNRMLDDITKLFSEKVDLKKPIDLDDKLFIDGKFKRQYSGYGFMQGLPTNNVGQANMGEVFYQAKRKKDAEFDDQVKKITDEIIENSKKKPSKKFKMPKFKNPRLGKKFKKWYETYVKKNKPTPIPEVEKEEPWISEKEANRLRVLAGLPRKFTPEPVIEVIVKRTRWERFRIFSFRQLSLLIWRIHPDAKVTTTVSKPSKFNFKSTPDVEFLLKTS